MIVDEKRVRLRSAVERLRAHTRGHADKRSADHRNRFHMAASRLRKDILDEFSRLEWPRFQMLDEIFSKGHGLPVATLSVCGEGTAEIRFTKLLAYFFDSRNPHGLGGLLARAVFAGRGGVGADLPFEKCTAESEVSLGTTRLMNNRVVQNSLDLLITVGDVSILIEQKIKSAEGVEQTRRYHEAVHRYRGGTQLAFFYLTPDGRTAHDENWQTLTHLDLFCRMASVLDRHALSAVAKHNLRALLWDLMLGPLAQDLEWLDGLRAQAHRIAKDVRRYADLKRWFAQYKLHTDERRVLLRLMEG